MCELFQTTAAGTIYGLLFAGLLLLPFQSHRATATSPQSAGYEDEYPVQEAGLLVNIVGGLIVVAIVLGVVGYVVTKYKAPKCKIVALTHPFESNHEGENVFWYGSNDPTSAPSGISDYTLSGRPNKDYAYYNLNIVRIEWTEHTEYYEATGDRWDYASNGYYSDYSPGNEGKFDDSETSRSGFVITWRTTENVDIMHTFASVVTKTTGGGKLSAEGDPGYESEAYVDLTDMSYGKDNDGHTSWTLYG